MLTKIYLNKRRLNVDGSATFYLIVTHNRKRIFLSTGIAIQPHLYCEKNIIKKNTPFGATTRLAVLQARQKLDDRILKLEADGIKRHLSVKQLKQILIQALRGDCDTDTPLFSQMALELSERKHIAETTKKTILTQAKSALRYLEDKEISSYTPEDIQTLSETLQSSKLKSSTIRAVLGKVKSVFARAVEKGYILKSPADGIKAPKAITRHRNLTIAQMRTIYQSPISLARDVFLLSFLLIGINEADLRKLKKKDLRNGRIEYIRAKTKKPYSVKVEPEAMEIINRYKAKGDLLLELPKPLNEEFRKMGEALLGEPITYYYARHSWATIAYSLDVPEHIIAQALGHATAHTITSIYIKRDEKKVDKANRAVIDYLLSPQA